MSLPLTMTGLQPGHGPGTGPAVRRPGHRRLLATGCVLGLFCLVATGAESAAAKAAPVQENLFPSDILTGPLSETTGLPPGWIGKAVPDEVVIEESAAAGGRCLRLECASLSRSKHPAHLPGMYRGVGLPANRGETFRYSVRYQGTAWLTLGLHLQLDKVRFSPPYLPLQQIFPPSPDRFATAAFEVEIPYDNTLLRDASVELDWVVPGFSQVTDFRLERVSPATGTTRVAAAAHPYHGLEELSRRWLALPFDRVFDVQAGRRVGERVVFRDTATGATLWRMTNGLGRTGNTYTHYPAWTADGKYVIGGAVITADRPALCSGAWLERADGSEFVHVPQMRFNFLNPADGRLVYALEPDPENKARFVLVEGDLEKMAKRVVCRLPEIAAEYGSPALSDVHPDGRMLLAFANLPPTQENKTRTSLGFFLSPETGLVQPFEYGGLVHNGGQFLRQPGDHTIGFGYEWGAYDWGTDRRTLPRSFFAVGPAAAVRPLISPEHPFLGDSGGGHFGLAADGRGIAMVTWYGLVGMGPQGERPTPMLRAGTYCDHVSWISHPDFLVTNGSGKLGTPLFRVAGDGKRFANRIAYANTATYNYPYYAFPFSVFSPDGTKIYFCSYMLGGENVYHAVARKPNPPRSVRVRRESGKVILVWEPPGLGREICGYQIYTATRSGGPYRLLTPNPVSRREFVPEPAPTAPVYMTVAAREWSGLLSGFSNEVCVAATGEWIGAARVLLEAERGHMTYPMQEQFAPLECGNLYAAGIAEPGGEGTLSLSVRLPRAATYAVWARVRSPGEGTSLRWQIATQAGTAAISARDWSWTKLGAFPLPAENVSVVISAAGRDFGIDQVLLTSEPADSPAGCLGEWGCTPSAPTDLNPQADGSFRIQLTWRAAPDEEDVDHYNVYAASEGSVAIHQSRLIGSPARPPFLDWGLRAGTGYRYLVTAVNRWGSEGPPAAERTCTTPAIEKDEVRVPAGAALEKNTDTEIRFQTRAKGEYMIWLRLGANPSHKMDWVGRYWLYYYIDDAYRGWKLSMEPLMQRQNADKESLWLAAGSGGDTDGIPFALEPGVHTVRIRGYNEPAALFLHEVIVTNDLGTAPADPTSFLDFIKQAWGNSKCQWETASVGLPEKR